MTPIDKELLKIKTKIGNSFFQAFYPLDYRSNKNIQKNIDDQFEGEVKRLRTLSGTTSQINQKIGKVLFNMSQEIQDLQDSLEDLQASVQNGDDILGNKLDQIEKTSSDLLGFLMSAGALEALRRKKTSSKRKQKKERARAEKEARARAEKEAREKAEKEAREKAKAEPEKSKAGETKQAAKPPGTQTTEPSTTPAEQKPGTRLPNGDVVADPAAPKPGGSIMERAGKTLFSWGESLVIKGTVITMAVVAAGLFLNDMWDLWHRTDLTKSEFRKEVTKLVARLVDAIGLAWAGAVIGTFVGSSVPVAGNLVGFFVGLAAGTALQMTIGDDIESMTDYIIETLWPQVERLTGTGDSVVVPGDQSVPATPDLSPTSPAPQETVESAPNIQAAPMASTQPIDQRVDTPASESVAVSPPIVGPTPPIPPLPQVVDSPVENPPPVDPTDLRPFDQREPNTPQSQSIVNEALTKAQSYVPQTVKEQEEYMQQLFGGGQQQGAGGGANTLDNQAQIDVYGGMSAGPGLGTISTSTGKTTEVAAQLVPNFQGFVNALESTGYRIKSIGGYADRNIKGKSKKSFHASGAAIDINPGENPHLYGGAMQTDMPQNVAEIARQFGLGWGGSWSSSKDTMHFSAASSEGGAFRVDRNTGEITPLADGGKVNPKKGGTLALIAEAGEPEYVVPQSKAIKFAHEMIAARPPAKTKKHTHYVVVPILT